MRESRIQTKLLAKHLAHCNISFDDATNSDDDGDFQPPIPLEIWRWCWEISGSESEMGQSKQLILSRLSATGTIVIVRPKMTSCLLGWLSLPPSTKKSSPLPSPPAPSSQAPSACFQVWTGAKTTMVSAPATEHQVISYTWWDKLGRSPCLYNWEQRRVGWRPRGGTPWGVWQKETLPEVQSPPFSGCLKPHCFFRALADGATRPPDQHKGHASRLSEARFTLKRLLFPILAHFSCGDTWQLESGHLLFLQERTQSRKKTLLFKKT